MVRTEPVLAGPANRVTLVRAVLVCGVTALVGYSLVDPVSHTALVLLAAVSLVLDAVDGAVARRTNNVTAFGARFDMEVDAFLILALSVYVAQSFGAWVLLIGLARYAFGTAAWALPWLRAPIPPSYWRKTVAALQGIVLTAAAAHVLPTLLSAALLAVALVLLAQSFRQQVRWLADTSSHESAMSIDRICVHAPVA